MEAGRAAARGLRSVFPGMPFAVAGIADGGEGTLEAVMSAREGRIVTVEVSGPYGKPVSAQYGICGDLAIVEIARAAGLNLSDPAERNPVIATTYGVGELIADALGRGARRFMIGLGGSATNDAGIGMLQALGWRFLDARGREIERGAGAESAGRVRMVDDSGIVSGVRESSFTVACDVTASLTGPLGATYVFGPQKGLRHEDLAKVDGWLGSFARVSAAHSGSDLSEEPGAGAAGGLGYAFRSYLGARMEPGIEMVLDAIGFDELLEEASLVITGEGRLDRQTCMGKAPSGVLRRAAARGIPDHIFSTLFHVLREW